jgi:phosphoglycerol transferase MdoB-like AlkP superfamily enzyme
MYCVLIPLPIMLQKIFTHRLGPVFLLFTLVVVVSSLTRTVLILYAFQKLDFQVGGIIGALSVGLLFDVVVASFFVFPLCVYLWLLKDSWYRQRWQKPILYLFFILSIIILVFNAIAEFIFWEEFQSRFNFIAVDYLVYTNEVMNNIIESYNMPLVITGLLLTGTLLFLPIKKKVDISFQSSMRFWQRTKWWVGYLLLVLAGYYGISNAYKNITQNRFINELGGNGMYEFGHAFWHNQLDYNTFYATDSNTTSFRLMQQLLTTTNTRFSTHNAFSTQRWVTTTGNEKKYNIVLISVESLSASFLQHFGNTQHITPVLDSLIGKSLFFDHFFASGTRTVRGLEALSLAIPPTPGQSIVKRMPTRQNLFTIGSVLKAKGYDTKYIYGGNAFFDNMGAFFGGNGYEVVDKSNIPKNRIHHETAWGVADEDLFDVSLQEMDKSYQKGTPFFNHIMTVSNHRPYTYPDGRIDIPSSQQIREGAVKYTDWSIGYFLKQAASKPWFNNTLFVIVADHCAKVAGKTEIPLLDYHIPCWIYAPQLITPRIEDRLVAQIDLAPTLLGLLNTSYTTKFYGYDIFTLEKGRERLLMGTYQNIAYVRNNKMVVLSPQKKIEMFTVNFITGEQVKIAPEDSLVKQAIAYYQTASYLFNNNGYNK